MFNYDYYGYALFFALASIGRYYSLMNILNFLIKSVMQIINKFKVTIIALCIVYFSSGQGVAQFPPSVPSSP